jgi:hypothetical protein
VRLRGDGGDEAAEFFWDAQELAGGEKAGHCCM